MDRCFAWRAAIRAAAVVLLVILGLAACSRTPPEARLRERIAEMQQALEAREVSGFMAGVAGDFAGGSGLDRTGLRNLVRVQVLRHAAIGVALGPLDVSLHGERATVTFSVMATGGSGGLLPDSARPWAVESHWRDGDDGWQVFHAEWEPAL